MKKLGLKGLLGIVALGTFITGCGVTVEQPETEVVSENEIGKVYLAGDEVEFDIRPQDDFYGYVNAEDLWNMEIAYDASTAGTFDKVYEQVDEELREIVKEVVSSDEEYEPGSDEQFIRDYYNLVKSGNYTDKKIFDNAFSMIDGASDIKELANVYGTLASDYGCDILFPVSVDVDSLNTSRYTLCLANSKPLGSDLKSMYESDGAVNNFRENLTDKMTGYGVERDTAEDMSDSIAYIWIDIVCNSDLDSERKHDMDKMLNKYTISELQDLLTNVDVEAYLKANGVNPETIDYLYVQDPVQLEVINNAFTEENLNLWKEYAKCSFVSTYARFAPDEYTNDDSSFEDMDEDAIIDEVLNFCDGNIGNLYMDKYYTEEMDEYMQRMKADLTDSYIQMINDADWLSPEGRALMVQKFENIEFHFGGDENREPDIEHAKVISGTLLETQINNERYVDKKLIGFLSETPDFSIWKMSAHTVNAYYDPNANSIYITTGIMNDPFFSLDADYYTNLGALGVVICHELSHAFDSDCIKYDANGMYNPGWISDADREAFQEIVDAVDAHYDEYALLEVYHVDGEQTVGENLADIGGMECVLNIADSKEEYEHVFTGYAKVWCTLYQNKDLIHYLEDDEHSPDIVRVNAVLSCFQEFYDTYDVKEGDGMYIAPEDRVVRW